VEGTQQSSAETGASTVDGGNEVHTSTVNGDYATAGTVNGDYATAGTANSNYPVSAWPEPTAANAVRAVLDEGSRRGLNIFEILSDPKHLTDMLQSVALIAGQTSSEGREYCRLQAQALIDGMFGDLLAEGRRLYGIEAAVHAWKGARAAHRGYPMRDQQSVQLMHNLLIAETRVIEAIEAKVPRTPLTAEVNDKR